MPVEENNAGIKKPPRLGIALIVSGPSGAGKSSVCSALRKRESSLRFSVSCTTRRPRPGEQDGEDYYFISVHEFNSKVRDGLFLEHADVHGNYYGTLKSEILDHVLSGTDVLLDIDVQGAMQVKKAASEDSTLSRCLELVFIGPPDFAELEKRLRGRGTESEEAISKRLADAKQELDCWNLYDYLLINKVLEKTVDDLHSLLDILHKKTIRLGDSGFYG